MSTLLSWNCRGVRNKVQDLKALLNFSQHVCVALQETFLKSNLNFNLRGANCVRKDVDSVTTPSGGVCILTSNSYPSSPLPLRTPLQAVAVQVHIRTLVTVCCIYLPHDVISLDDLNALVDQLPAPFLLIGYFNGHSTLWSSDCTNSRGRQIEQFISDNCLCLLNENEKTYFHEPTRTFHSLGLAICSPSLLPMLNFRVGGDLYNSDHFPLVVSYADSACVTQRPQRYLFQRADWAAFRQLAVITETMVVSNNIDEAIKTVTDQIISAADVAIPKSSSHPRKFRKPWWNDACREAYQNQRRLWGIFRRYPTLENHIAFKKARATARRIRCRSQRESWMTYISSITSATSSAQLWQKVKAANGIYKEFSFSVIRTGTTLYSLPIEVANIIGQGFAKESSADSYSPTFLVTKRRTEQIPLNFKTRKLLPYNCVFRMYELRKALSEVKDTSPGPHGI
ncbi:hypothetical protein AVEN_76435-1, partial [Araneus ventricosus]